MYHETFAMFAAYNRWANRRIYEVAGALPDGEFVADRGLFFGSVMRTLNHILVADRIWMKRFTGRGEAPGRLDAVLHETFEALRAARESEDERIAGFVAGLDEAGFSRSFTYSPISVPGGITQPLAPALFHLFNHQTHHRGQVHAALTGLGEEGPALDMSAFLRERSAQA
jgi:uncharacterized damage-inducible protein DinB